MAKRLIKIAKELNVGTATIVDFLNENGFEIDNKPTSKVSDDMYDALLKEFSSSMAVKEKADQLIIGTRQEEKTVEVIAPPPPPPPPPPIIKKEEKPVEKVLEEPVVEPEVVSDPEQISPPVEEKKEEEVIRATIEKKELKVVGKIDLDATKPKPKKKETKSVKDKEPEQKAPPVIKKEEPEVIATKAPPEEMVRAETPQLQGLKIQGKIDIAKFDKPEKKKDDKPAAGQPNKGKNQQKNQNQNKRKRTRKKVTAQSFLKRNRDNRGNKGGNKKSDEIKTVSKKEIEEKIKATMARMERRTDRR